MIIKIKGAVIHSFKITLYLHFVTLFNMYLKQNYMTGEIALIKTLNCVLDAYSKYYGQLQW